MYFKGIYVGKVINTAEDLLAHSYPHQTEVVPAAEPDEASALEPVEASVQQVEAPSESPPDESSASEESDGSDAVEPEASEAPAAESKPKKSRKKSIKPPAQ